MKTEVFDTPEAFLSALAGKKRAPAKQARPELPRAPRAASTGLTTLIAGKGRVWSLEFRVGKGVRLYVLGGDLDTGFQPDEATCCAAAKGMRG